MAQPEELGQEFRKVVGASAESRAEKARKALFFFEELEVSSGASPHWQKSLAN